MSGLLRKATLLSVGGLLIAGSAFASVPNAGTSLVPCGIDIVGHNLARTVADPSGTFTVLIRDVSGTPINGTVVTVDFSGCCNDIQLSNTQFGAQVMDALNKKVSATTNASGIATFDICGGANSVIFPAVGPRPALLIPTAGAVGCAVISAGGTIITDGIAHPQVNVGVYDLNGARAGGAGVGGPDLALWLDDFFSGGAPYFQYRQRGDYDHQLAYVLPATPTCGASAVGGPDEARWLRIFFGADNGGVNGSITNGGAVVPAGTGSYATCP